MPPGSFESAAIVLLTDGRWLWLHADAQPTDVPKTPTAPTPRVPTPPSNARRAAR